MSEKDKQIVSTIQSALPNLTEEQKNRLLGFGDGIAALAATQGDNPTIEKKGA